jgi:hypothetical protein
MFGQLPDWFWLWLDWLWFEFAVMLEPEEFEEEDEPLAGFAIAAPPPAMAPTATIAASTLYTLFIVVHLLSLLLVVDFLEPVNRRPLRTI